MKDVAKRIKYIMQLNRLNASAFAEKIGVQKSSVSHVLTERNKPSLEFIQKTLEAFPKVDSNWLLIGKVANQTKEVNIENDSSVEGLRNSDEKNEDLITKKSPDSKTIQKIVFFYSDNTFHVFQD